MRRRPRATSSAAATSSPSGGRCGATLGWKGPSSLTRTLPNPNPSLIPNPNPDPNPNQVQFYHGLEGLIGPAAGGSVEEVIRAMGPLTLIRAMQREQ